MMKKITNNKEKATIFKIIKFIDYTIIIKQLIIKIKNNLFCDEV